MRIRLRLFTVVIALAATHTIRPAAQVDGTPLASPNRLMLSATSTNTAELLEAETVVARMLRVGELAVVSTTRDREVTGRWHQSLRQEHMGVPVVGGSVLRQLSSSGVVSVLGTVYTGIEVSVMPRMSSAEALAALQRAVPVHRVGSEPQLVILPMIDGGFSLVYRVTASDFNTYFLDAMTAETVQTLSEIREQGSVGVGTGVLGDPKKLSTTQVGQGEFRTIDQLRPANVFTFDTRGSEAALDRMLSFGRTFDSDVPTDSDNNWSDPGVIDAHVHTGWTVDYLFKRHGWRGFDGRDGAIINVLHRDRQFNAFFIPPPFGPAARGAIVFGDTPGGVPITTLEVVAHESMHAVTEFSLRQRTGGGLGNVLYQDGLGPTSFTLQGDVFPCDSTVLRTPDGRDLPLLCQDGRYVLASNHPGAINEGYSDIFGTSAEFYFQPAGSGPLRAEYLVGEDVSGFGPIRSMNAPQTIGVPTNRGLVGYPDHRSRLFRFAIVITRGTRSAPTGFAPVPLVFFGNTVFELPDDDFAGVHLNSTVLSHAFYLAIEGGRNATSGVTMEGAGRGSREAVERVFFRAMSVLMPSGPGLSLAANVICQAAVDLYGHSSPITAAIDQALFATGLRPAPAIDWCRAL
jgi:Zn-dependent metalloprotease